MQNAYDKKLVGALGLSAIITLSCSTKNTVDSGGGGSTAGATGAGSGGAGGTVVMGTTSTGGTTAGSVGGAVNTGTGPSATGGAAGSAPLGGGSSGFGGIATGGSSGRATGGTMSSAEGGTAGSATGGIAGGSGGTTSAGGSAGASGRDASVDANPADTITADTTRVADTGTEVQAADAASIPGTNNPVLPGLNADPQKTTVTTRAATALSLWLVERCSMPASSRRLSIRSIYALCR